MFFSIITYTSLLLLSAQHMVSAAPSKLSGRQSTQINVAVLQKYQKAPNRPFHLSTSMCNGTQSQFGGYDKGIDLYNNVLAPHAWLAGDDFLGDVGDPVSLCGRCVEPIFAANPDNIYLRFLIVDLETYLEFTTAGPLSTKLWGVEGTQFYGVTRQVPLSECLRRCDRAAPNANCPPEAPLPTSPEKCVLSTAPGREGLCFSQS
ncbi:hypothetical protein TWF718_003515 [Orbilia javanica]|uniref:Uncharacterized protein n=1 Tax=Orbilia javanica TaxID=47235 RepID=A0AAN8RBH3_9PEZI